MGSGSPWCGCRLSCLCLLLWKTARGRVFPFGRRLQPHEGYMCSETLSLFLSNVWDLRCLDLNHFSQKTINTKCAILDLVSRGNKALHLFKPKRLKSTLYFRPMTKLKFKWVSGLLALNQHGGNGDEHVELIFCGIPLSHWSPVHPGELHLHVKDSRPFTHVAFCGHWWFLQ